MRLDKFLKVSRLIKRRPVAKKQVEAGKVLLNNKTAKASSEVKVGDVLNINSRIFVINQLLEYATEEKAKTMYEEK